MTGVTKALTRMITPPKPRMPPNLAVEQQQTQAQVTATSQAVDTQSAAAQREAERLAEREAAAEETRRRRRNPNTNLLNNEVGLAPTTAPAQRSLGG